jgi:hypothetical protein
MIAPRALTVREVAQVIAPQLIAYGLIHRAATFGNAWDAEPAATSAIESALESVREDAGRSLGEWLADVDNDGEPRFFRKTALVDVIRLLCASAAQVFCRQSAEDGVKVILSQLEDRDETLLNKIIADASL